MASPSADLEKFAQKVYLTMKNRYYDDIASEDGQNYIDQVIDWVAMFIDELETEVDGEGKPLDWTWNKFLGYTLGTASEGGASIALPTAVNNLLTGEQRYVQILQDGTAVSNWAVVAADQITNQKNRITEDMVTVTGNSTVGRVVTFSRAFRDYEDGGTIVGDVTLPLPQISQTNVKLLSIVKPMQLLVLGVAKNSTLPDIVQGGLSPSFTQKYESLLQGAIARNTSGAVSTTAVRENFSGITGVY